MFAFWIWLRKLSTICQHGVWVWNWKDYSSRQGYESGFSEFFSSVCLIDFFVYLNNFLRQCNLLDFFFLLTFLQLKASLTRFQFIEAALRICEILRKYGYWADFIDPSSGKPVRKNAFGSFGIMRVLFSIKRLGFQYLSKSTRGTLPANDERYRTLGFRVTDFGCCKVSIWTVWLRSWRVELRPTLYSEMQQIFSGPRTWLLGNTCFCWHYIYRCPSSFSRFNWDTRSR